VAVAALTRPGHAGQTHVITGPEGLSHEEVAAALAKASGRPVTYRDMPPAALREQLLAAGTAPWLVDVRMEFTEVLREGFGAAVTDTVARTTGRPPRTFAAFADEHAARFRGAAAG